MRKQLVFISSRIKEMRQFREAAERAIAEAGMLRVFVEKDTIRLGVKVVRQIEEAVRSAHVFVGLYGYTLDPNPVPKGYDKHYLELEFEWAQEAGLTRLCYEPAAEYAELYDPPATGFDRDVRKFREDVLEYGVGFLTTPQALYEDLLEQLTALKPRIFISYSSEELDFVNGLVKRLRESGYSPWFNVSNIAPGSEWEPELMKGIEETAVVVLVVSPGAMKSSWVRKEWEGFLASKKPVLQLLYREAETPPELKAIQGIKFKEDDDGWYYDLLREIEARL
jgi:hypothetical protein